MKSLQLSKVLVSIMVLLLVIFISRLVDQRFDLTADGRYTLAPEAGQMVSLIDEPIIITSFLEGNVPSSFRHFQSYIEDYLLELRRYNPYLEVIYKDVSEGTDEDRREAQEYLASNGVIPLSRQVTSEEEVSQQLVYPYLSVHTTDRITFVNLLEQASIQSSEEESLISAQIAFESKLLRAIRQVVRKNSPNVYLIGASAGLIAEGASRDSRLNKYNYQAVDADLLLDQVNEADVVVSLVKRADQSREELLAIDVAASRGVPVLWAIDKTSITLDSFRRTGNFLAIAEDYKVEDYLYKMGVRISPDLIMDIQSSRIPQIVNPGSETPQAELYKYPFHPILLSDDNTPVISRLSNPLSTYFVSSIDILEYPKTVKKESILLTSEYTQKVATPALLDFQFMQQAPRAEDYNKGSQCIGAMLEGRIKPYFINRLTKEDVDFLANHNLKYDTDSQYIHQVVISDMDWLSPQKDFNGKYNPIGYNPYDGQMYDANADLFVRLLEYLIDGDDLLKLSDKQSAISFLDRQRLAAHRITYDAILIALPLTVLLIIYLAYHYIRRKRYAG